MKLGPSRWIAAAAAILLAVEPSLAATLTALSTFAGDGWRAPNEIVDGDSAGTSTGSNYNYLGTGNLERGLAYNSTTGNLVLVSRSAAGNGIRLLSGVTGADIGAINQGSGVITGGTFAINMAAVAEDGAIFVGNLQTSAATAAYKVYRWGAETDASPTTFFGNTVSGFTGTPRLGDTLDVIGSGPNTTLVSGVSGAIGYAIINASGATALTLGAAPPDAGDFRLGITFAGSASDIWGKQTGADRLLRETTYAGTALSLNASSSLTAISEAPMDYAVVGGRPLLATIDITSSLVRVYDVTTPASPLLIASATTTSGTLAANGNGVGQVKFGSIGANSATLYAMSTNQGIQALTLTGVPEPSGAGLLAISGLALCGFRRRHR